ncbi:MAG: RluA family pseudouridine synthase [Comamonas sp.]|nr:RluA family pseudouridine synthase [Comamonas sp.]
MFEDEHLLVFNKPAGLLCVPGRGPEKQDCLSTRVQSFWPEALVVHRLDMATSGLVIMARSKEVQRSLSDSFASRTVEKLYAAIVAKDVQVLAERQWHKVDAPIMSDWERRPLQKVDFASGKPSLSLYRRHEDQTGVPSGCTKIWLRPVTGRTHQLRLHMSHIGHPILGDELYAPPSLASGSHRLMLHATELRFVHPILMHEILVNTPPQFDAA